jgi:putative addiction module killer protein
MGRSHGVVILSLLSYTHHMRLIHYRSSGGKDLYQIWLDSLRDTMGRIAIMRRVDRLIDGNFRGCKPCRGGVSELRIDNGPGYRVYFSQLNENIVLLLCGGDKSSQTQDINQAVEHLADFKARGGYDDE